MSGLFTSTNYNPLQSSVDDAMQSVRCCTSIQTLSDWLHYERNHMQRRTLIRAIESRVRRLRREAPDD